MAKNESEKSKKIEKILTEDEKKQLEFSKHFINTTKAILRLNDNDDVKSLNNENYKSTLFINCLYGLLMMPLKLNNENIRLYGFAKEVLSKNNLFADDKISFSVKEDENPSFEQFIRSIRNGLGHWNEPRKNDSFPQGVKIDDSQRNLLINGSYTIYKNKNREKDKVVHITTSINFSDVAILLNLASLISEPKIFMIKIEKDKDKKVGSCNWKSTKVFLNSRRLDYYNLTKVLLQPHNELKIIIGGHEQIFSVTQFPVKKTIEINKVVYQFTLFKSQEQ